MGRGELAFALASTRSKGIAETLQMQKDYLRRKANADQKSTVGEAAGAPPHRSYLPHRQGPVGSIKDNSGAEVIGDRIILYIHGGAFFFSSLDTHRYQVQRHARKAGARAFCPAYRLAPQYPFVSKDLASALHRHFSADGPTRSHAASSMPSRRISIFCTLPQVHTSQSSPHRSSLWATRPEQAWYSPC